MFIYPVNKYFSDVVQQVIIYIHVIVNADKYCPLPPLLSYRFKYLFSNVRVVNALATSGNSTIARRNQSPVVVPVFVPFTRYYELLCLHKLAVYACEILSCTSPPSPCHPS